MSALDENGLAIAATSTVNLWFGCKIRGARTGIIFNDGMDDFSTPGFDNDFGVPPSPMNFIAPGKRPVSSMTPTLVIDNRTKEPIVVTGGSGGTKITTGVLQVLLNILKFNYSGGDAVKRQSPDWETGQGYRIIPSTISRLFWVLKEGNLPNPD